MFFISKRRFEEAVAKEVSKEMNRYDHDRFVDDRLSSFSRELEQLRGQIYQIGRCEKTEVKSL